MKHLVDCYKGEGLATLKRSKVKIVLKDVALISRSRTVKPGLEPNAIEQLNFKDRFFLGETS